MISRRVLLPTRYPIAFASICCILAVAIPSVLNAQSSAPDRWGAFLKSPSEATYKPLSEAIRACVGTSCKDGAIAGSEDNFANFYKLLAVVEKGNSFATELAFEIRPLYKNAAAPAEDLDNSLGLASTSQAAFFLRLVRKYDLPDFDFEYMVGQTSSASIDNPRAQREELTRRIKSFLNVNDPELLPLRQKAILFIQKDINSIPQ